MSLISTIRIPIIMVGVLMTIRWLEAHVREKMTRSTDQRMNRGT